MFFIFTQRMDVVNDLIKTGASRHRFVLQAILTTVSHADQCRKRVGPWTNGHAAEVFLPADAMR